MNSYHSVNAFWFKFSEPTGKMNLDGTKAGPRKRFSWTMIMKQLKEIKQVADGHDVEEARNRFADSEAFTEAFSYRKGNKRIPLKKVDVIARKYRKMIGKPRFWDPVDEDDEEDQEYIVESE